MAQQKRQQSPTFWDVGSWRPEIRRRSSSMPAALEWYDPVAVARYSPTFRDVTLEPDTGERQAITPAPAQGIRRMVLTQQWGWTLARGSAMATLVGGLLMASPVATVAAQSLDPPPPVTGANDEDFLERLIEAIGEDSPLWQFVSPEDGSALWSLIERVGPDHPVWDELRKAGPDHVLWQYLRELGADNPIWDEILPQDPRPTTSGPAVTGQPSVSGGILPAPPVEYVERTGNDNPLGDALVGARPAPTFVDIDNDGDFDAFIGNKESITILVEDEQDEPTVELTGCEGQVQFFENLDIDNGGGYGYAHFVERTGTLNPFNDYNVSGPDNVGCNPKPFFVDIDNAGDYDAFIGNKQGTIKFYENQGTAESPNFVEQTGPANNPLNAVNVVRNSAPALVDLDGDNDFDAVIGNKFGTIEYWKNEGTAGSPNFVQQTLGDNPFSGVDVGLDSTPALADIDRHGDHDALIGNKWGTISFFENADVDGDGELGDPIFFQRTDDENPFFEVDVGMYSTPAMVDIDGDGDFDVFVGAVGDPDLLNSDVVGDPIDGGEYDLITQGKGGGEIHFFEAVRPVGGVTEPFSPLQALGPWVASAAVGLAGAAGVGSALLRRKRRQS